MKVQFNVKSTPGYRLLENMQMLKVVDRKTNATANRPQGCKEIFATNYTPAEFKDKRFRFMILLTDSKDKKLDAAATQDFLNQAEKELKFAKSRVWNVSDQMPKGTQALLIDASCRWGQSSPLLHLLLLLARNGSGHLIGSDWKQTLARFRRVETFKPADQAQFVVVQDVLPHIIAKRGRLENLSAIIEQRERAAGDGIGGYYTSRNSEQRNWQFGRGICQWAGDFKTAKEQKLVLEAH